MRAGSSIREVNETGQEGRALEHGYNVTGSLCRNPAGAAFFRITIIMQIQQAGSTCRHQTKSTGMFLRDLTSRRRHRDERVGWADWVVGVIQNRTRGSRLVFYNDHSGGQDMRRWKELGLRNYPNVHGVIFHGTPTDHSPNTPAYSTFKDEKIFQVSTDAFPYQGPQPNPRDTKEPNRIWTNHAFNFKMMFQAHSNSDLAAQGIGAADIKPTKLV